MSNLTTFFENISLNDTGKTVSLPQRKEFIQLIKITIEEKSSHLLLSMVDHNNYFNFIENHLYSLDNEELFLLGYKVEYYWELEHIENTLFFAFKQYEYSIKEQSIND